MSKSIVVVESPAKAKTIKKYLGKDFEVLASYGHVRDLVPKSGAIDIENNFAMHYQVVEKNSGHVSAIAKALKAADTLYLATDPDREGEAIAWHIQELMAERKLLKAKPVHRAVFHEITKKAILEAIAKPRTLAMNLVDAQQARRALDYLVGFNLSPLLWKKIRYGLSAGRVQSPALRMIVTREEEIEAFIIQEYWTISAQNLFGKSSFTSKLWTYQGERLTQFSIQDQNAAEEIKRNLLNIANGQLVVSRVEKKKKAKHPAPPFTTSTLQQEAAHKLGMSAKRTMSIAQKLYEAGYITYMRTDSVNLAAEAITELRQTITKFFGSANLPEQPNYYKTKLKSAQEAHEAIRPTCSGKGPDELATILNPEQAKLYGLIWKRTVASQMVSAVIDAVTIDLACGKEHSFRANGSVVVKPGFLSVYQEEPSELAGKDTEEAKVLPPLQVGDLVTLKEITCNQHFTEPPPRYSEATLVKALEEYGIGRPSTYASILDTLTSRNYAVLDNRRFKPTDVGRVVNKFLTGYFPKYVDYTFTAHLENELDEIANDKFGFHELMREFWAPFKHLIDEVSVKVKRADVTEELLEQKCPKCNSALTSKLGKNGRFVGCSNYPSCDYTANIEQDKLVPTVAEVVPDRTCPECGSSLHIKVGRYGKFVGCSNYPKCKFIEPLEKPLDSGVVCPVCNDGSLLKRKSRYGKYFYSCSTYPKCKYAIWNEPLNQPCPKCGWKILTKKITKRKGEELVCPQKECGYHESVSSSE